MQTLVSRFAEKIRQDEILGPYTSFGIGGPADLYLEVESREELLDALDAARQDGVSVFLLGGGSNLLISDLGIAGLVVRNRWRGIMAEHGVLRVAAGTTVAALVQYGLDQGDREGFEFLAGLPGTIGGAVCGNAGAYGRSIADLLISATLLTPSGEVIIEEPGKMDFDYRESRVKTSGEIILDVSLCLPAGNGHAARKLVDEYISNRVQKHPGRPLGCAGSYFKNLPGAAPGDRRTAAGWLLEQVGAKGFSVGNAGVFEKHANMIVNRGGARALEVLILADKMKQAVRRKFAVQLEEEVRFVGRRQTVPEEV